MQQNTPNDIDKLLIQHFKNKKQQESEQQPSLLSQHNKDELLQLASQQAKKPSQMALKKYLYLALAACVVGAVSVMFYANSSPVYIHGDSDVAASAQQIANNKESVQKSSNIQSEHTLQASDINKDNVLEYLQNNSIQMAEVIPAQNDQTKEESPIQPVHKPSTQGIQVREAPILPAGTDVESYAEAESIKNSH